MATTQGGPNTQLLIDLTREDVLLGLIDPVDALSSQQHRVYLFSGQLDSVVDPDVMRALQQYYLAFLDSSAFITTEFEVPAEHCMPTLDYGVECTLLEFPYLGKCAYDGAGEGLQAIYSPQSGYMSNPRAANMVDANFFSFDQRPFFATGSVEALRASLADSGFIYVPTACQQGAACSLHIAFHGCHMGVDEAGDTYARNSGYNEWAESNNLVVLYPSARASIAEPINPNG